MHSKGRIMKSLLVLILLSLITACQSTKNKKKSEGWSGQMQSMANHVGELIPFVYNRAEFQSTNNHNKILDQLSALNKSAHNVPIEYSKKYLGDDPIIKFSARNLNKDLVRAQKVFEEGNKEYARGVIKGALNHCFRCHTRNQFGPEYMQWNMNIGAFNIPPTSKVQLYIATRQYQKAKKEVEGFLNQKFGVYNNSFEQEKALKQYLALSVRVEKKPAETARKLQLILKNDKTPTYLKESLKSWIRSLWIWSKESNPQEVSLKKANQLIRKAIKIREFQSLDTANVEYLRATSVLHDMIAKTKDKKTRAQIFSLLGDSYDVLSEGGFWEIPELYYEACVREWPRKGSLSKKCFIGYERSIILGYSGSMGILVPSVEKEKLLELKKMAGLE